MITIENIKKLLVTINEDLKPNDLDGSTKLSEQGVESLDTFDLFLRIEEEYGVEVSDEKIEDLNTIQKIVDHVNQERK